MEVTAQTEGSILETSGTLTPPSAPAVAEIHKHLDAAERAYHDLFDGHVPDEVHRFEQFLSTVRMVVDQSADSASKE